MSENHARPSNSHLHSPHQMSFIPGDDSPLTRQPWSMPSPMLQKSCLPINVNGVPPAIFLLIHLI